jgi:hypothetical protein
VLADLHRWEASEPIDVLISNATLHWVPGPLAPPPPRTPRPPRPRLPRPPRPPPPRR